MTIELDGLEGSRLEVYADALVALVADGTWPKDHAAELLTGVLRALAADDARYKVLMQEAIEAAD